MSSEEKGGGGGIGCVSYLALLSVERELHALHAISGGSSETPLCPLA